MTSPSAGSSGLDRCPRCAAAVPAGAQWCGLCWADLRPAPPPPPAPPPVPPAAPAAPAVPGWEPARPADSAASAAGPVWGAAGPVPPAVDPLTAPLHEVAGGVVRPDPRLAADPTWPCTRCGAANPMEAEACRSCGAPFLAAARTAPSGSRLLRMSRRERFAWAGAVVLLLCAATALLALVG